MDEEKRNRQKLEQIENRVLSSFAAKSFEQNSSRLIAEAEHGYRTTFQRDRDRIIHSRAFRRLKHKRQVFLTHFGDHYRTRLTHTLEVSQLARTMARTIGVNEDLVEAIALGHDLGHTPFGHIGEIVLHRIMSGQDDIDGLLSGQNCGGFKHNYQSLRVVDVIEKKYSFNGLNLCAAVREGILKHTSLRREELLYPDFDKRGLHYELDNATTLEGQIVAVCDEIAQRTHDLEDGIRAGYVELNRMRELKIIRQVERLRKIESPEHSSAFVYRNRLINSLIDYLVTDVIDASFERLSDYPVRNRPWFEHLIVWFSGRIDPLQKELDVFITREIIAPASEARSDTRAIRILRRLFGIYYKFKCLLPEYLLLQCVDEKKVRALVQNPTDEQSRKTLTEIENDPNFIRILCDHIAGMTDSFAEKEIERLEFHEKDKRPEE